MTVFQTLTDRGVKEPKTTKHKTKEPLGSERTKNDRGRKRHRETPPESAQTNGSSDSKRSRHEEGLKSIQEKVDSSNNFNISLLNTHLEKDTCFKTLRYNERASITPDEDFKKDINSSRKKAEKALVGALVKFHYTGVRYLVLQMW